MTERKLPKLSEQTAAYKLFHYPFMWLVPENSTYDVNSTEYFGLFTSGDADVDFARASMDTARYLSTDEAAALHATGARVTISDPCDAVAIYKYIVQHLEDWLNYVEKVQHFKRNKAIPIKGLKEFNDLATILVPVARRHGLVDQLDLYSANRARRGFSSRYEAPHDPSKAVHSNVTYNKIAAVANAKNRR